MSRIGRNQAETLLKLAGGYIVTRDGFYDALIARGLVEVSSRYWVGDLEYHRSGGHELPAVTPEGLRAIQTYADRNGPVEAVLLWPGSTIQTVLCIVPTNQEQSP